jgi:hypothetical protein
VWKIQTIEQENICKPHIWQKTHTEFKMNTQNSTVKWRKTQVGKWTNKWKNNSSRGIYRRQIDTWKHVQHHQSLKSENCDMQSDTPIHTLEWLSPKRHVISSVGKDMKK